MVVQASPQITAAQVLDAGRRAEADGRVEYAIQFYRHLADHHAGAPEAAVAREALSRLRRQSSMEGPGPDRVVEPPPIRASGRRLSAAVTRAAPAAARAPLRITPAGAAQHVPPLDLPEPVRGYYAGRLIAHGLSVAGVLAILAGLLAFVSGALLPSDAAVSVPGWHIVTHPLAGPIAAGTGIMLVLWGQIARALFDIALSSRDMAAIERAKAEHAMDALR